MSKKRNYRLFLFVLLLADILAIGGLSVVRMKNAIPDKIYIREGQKDGLTELFDWPMVTYPDTIDVSDQGSYQIPCSLLGIFPLKQVQVETVEEKVLSVCGTPIGLYMETQGVLIVDTGEIVGEDGISREPAENIAKSGDYILEVNGSPITRKKQLIEKIQESQGESMELLVERIMTDESYRDCWEFCRRMLEDETCREVAVRTEAEFGGRRLREKSEKECFEAMDRTGYGELNEERLRCAIEMGLLVIIRISMLQLDQAADPRELKNMVYQQFAILDRGIRD